MWVMSFGSFSLCASDLNILFLFCLFHRFLCTAIAFFEHVNLLYGAVSEYCTPTSCPDMLGPGQR